MSAFDFTWMKALILMLHWHFAAMELISQRLSRSGCAVSRMLRRWLTYSENTEC